IPVHLYGQVVDMDPLRELASRYSLKIIEDACQSHGAAYNEQRAGSFGDAAAFSFYYSKNLGAFGEGGFISTNDPEIYRKARMIRDHGSDRRYYHDMLGMNARLDEIQAVVLRAKLPHLEEYNRLRREHAALYKQLLADLPVTVPVELPGNHHIYHMYVVRAPRRDELQTWLKEHGIGTGIHYPVPIHLQHSMSHAGGKIGDLPVTEEIVGQILSLPMYPELSDEAIHMVVDSIREFFNR
ncbi:MAG TPA: DegT/DnrJ/EryC1/StrS family aminotransferase, partial [Anaerolineaceae bacterium]|nr:DegT/DnrJ/EryC1/StrS family aminotransferase [Anaerolineaceae bacterium]